ncbi:hypothetical protein FB565_008033 [Actinoplanes lutulentus]|uniref:NACHT domain-containing protein n=1 Tax=Actinoplanes lutulentus TaxID=1287878 RepID=A0A327ZCT9_9ACTN|nr:NACHT domain-containing protein [Actinoplanes lutulentus]MBB2948250.1 hypothetical protein [Actinoplanes lutulentus]RAK31252.1 NACHT domain-containing protein [Actinoplanes lutulentus]
MDYLTPLLKAATRALPFIGKMALEHHQRQKIAANASTAVRNWDQTQELVATLAPGDAAKLEQFFASPQFEGLMQQAMVCAVTRHDEQLRTAIRAELRESLRHTQAFTDDTLFEATDTIEALLHGSVHAVRSAGGKTVDRDATSAALATRMATAAARNTELLRRVETLTRFDEFTAKLRTSVVAVHGRLRLTTLVRTPPVDYAGLYVPPKITPQTKHQLGYGETADFSSLLTHRTGLVILGDPGAGKSTLAGKLAYDLATDAVDGWTGQVPIVLVVRDHTSSLRTDHQTLLHYLEAACRKPYNQAPPTDALEYLLLNGLATVIIDGVDELGDSHFRVTFAKMVDAFASQYPTARIVVTSRVVGYDEAPVSEDMFTAYRVVPFDEDQVTRYATSWFALEADAAQPDRDLAASFLQESQDSDDLRSNPLMLSLLCALYSSEGYIPRNRPAVYERCAELLFDTWDRSRGIAVPHTFRAQVRPAVQQLAWRMFTDPQARQAVPRSEVEKFLADEVLAKRYADTDEATQAAHEFLTFCAGRAWVLTDLGSDRIEPHYGFVHRTFLEYFAAAQLVKLKPQPEAVWERLSPHIADASWTVVAQIALQILDRDCEDGATQLLEIVLDEAAPAGEEMQGVLLDFGVLCAQTVLPDNDTLLRLTDACVTRSLADPDLRRGYQFDVPARRFSSLDRPLTHLVNTKASDDDARIGRALGESLRAVAEGASTGDGAILTAMIMRRPGASSDFAAALYKALEPLPSEVTTWRRVISNPVAEDLTRHGFESLFKLTYACSLAYGRVAEYLVGSVFPGPIRDGAIDDLENLYPAVFMSPVPFDFLTETDGWSDVLGAMSFPQLMEIARPRARAVALALMLPLLQPGSKEIHDPGCQFLLEIRRNGDADGAERLIRRLQLPEEAAAMLLDWAATPLPKR